MAPVTALPVNNGSVLSDTIVPDDNGALLPLHTGLEVGSPGNVLVEELENGVRLLLLEADNLTGDCANPVSLYLLRTTSIFG